PGFDQAAGVCALRPCRAIHVGCSLDTANRWSRSCRYFLRAGEAPDPRPGRPAWPILFLLPFAAVLMALSIPYAERSWAILERSRETSGLPFVYLLKTLIPVFA